MFQIRIKFIEKPYRFWRNLSSDTRNALIPFALSAIMGISIYKVNI